MWRLDGSALFRAIDEERRQRGCSRADVARQTGVSASTLQRIQWNGPMETDGVVSAVRWLRRPLEDFIRGAEETSRKHRDIAQHRFSCKALFAALDMQRQARGMSWTAVASELGGFSPGMLTRLAKGGRIGAHVMVPAVGWLGRTVASFCTDAAVTGKVDGSREIKAGVLPRP